ncbi:unnamed protein product [Rhizophagus irregularis]|nr:unnamed protein product [Rhizophagus irregularis]
MGRNGLFFRNGSFGEFLRIRGGTTGRNDLFFRNGSFGGFLRMQEIAQGTSLLLKRLCNSAPSISAPNCLPSVKHPPPFPLTNSF